MGRMALSLAALNIAWAAASQGSAQTPALQTECQVQVWQSKDYVSEAPSVYAAYGLIGTIAQGVHDSRYPEGSTERQMEAELRQEVVRSVVEAAPWNGVTGSTSHRVTFADKDITRDAIKELRSGKQRNSESVSPCLVELYVDRQTFLGGMVQSNLMSEFTVRHFQGSSVKVANGKTFKKTKGFPAKDEAGVEAASASFRAAFVDNLNDFLAKKKFAAVR